MESQDVFAQEISAEDDPFAGTDFGDFGDQPESPAPPQAAPQPTAELPVVDREGKAVPAEGLPTLSAEQAAAEAQSYREEKGEDPQQPSSPPDPTTASAGAQDPPASAAEAPQGTAETPEESVPEAPPSEAAASPGDAPTPAGEVTPDEPATPSADEGSLATTSEPEVPATPALAEAVAGLVESEAPVPEETKDGRGRVTHRRYIILRVDGPGKFSQLHWYVDDKGKMVPKGPGAKRQTVALARGAEEALKVGFVAIGGPQDGATLIAVAAAYFQAKKVKPLPPEPSKQRLSIS